MNKKQLKSIIKEEYQNVKSFMEYKYGFTPELGKVISNPYAKSFVNEVKEPEVISQLRDILKNKQNAKIKDPVSGKKMRVDSFSASAVIAVYDAINDSNKKNFGKLSLPKMVNVAFKVAKVRKESVNELLVIVDKFDKNKQDYGKIYYRDGGSRPGDGDINKAKKELAKLSKKHKDLTLVSIGRNSKMYDVMDESVNEAKFYITRNLGRGQGKSLVGGYDLKRDKKLPPKVFKSYKDAQKEIEKLERGGSMGGQMTAYYVTDKDMNPIKESVNEAKSMDMKKRLKVYDKLKKGDKITIKYGSSMRGGVEKEFVVSKGKTLVGKQKVERIILQNPANPKGVKYYLYQRNGNVTMAIGDMAATIEDMHESIDESTGLAIIHKAAKKGSYPVSIVATMLGKVVKQELVKTPMAVPAAFRMMQGGYPRATIAIEDRTGKILFKEGFVKELVNEGMFKVIDQIRQDSKDARDFIKNVFSDPDFKDMRKDKEFLKYLKSIYEGFSSDAQRKAAFANGYEEKGKKKKESIEEYDVENYQDVKEFIEFMKEQNSDIYALNPTLQEAEYQGRDVKLGKIMQGDVKKFKVYVKNPKGNVVKVNFGHKGKGNEKTMSIKKNNPERRKAFRARHNCDNPGPRHKARYWSCKKW